TSIPVWSKHVELLPVHFGASALASATSLLELRGHRQPALNALGILAAAFETGAAMSIDKTRDRESAPLRNGDSGAKIRIAGALSGAVPLALRVLGGKSRKARQLAALSTLAGSLLTRFAWIDAGRASAQDPNVPLGLSRKL
ncbi:MAG TPA: hypothetical protein VF698_17045, partial [Thermoanaerobaculia bacterium]